MPMPDEHIQRKKTGTGAMANPLAWLLILALAGTALAGCLAVDTDTENPGGTAPVASLESDRDERWTHEAFTLDARDSSAGGTNLTQWRIDLGDGTVHEGDNLSEAVVQHAYTHSGVYEVRLSVSGTLDDENVSTEATQVLEVNERHAVPEETLYAAPVEESPTARSAHVFPIHENATSWETDLHLENSGLVESELLVKVLDADNQTLAEDNLTLQPGEQRTVRFAGDTTGPGNYTLELQVDSGGVETTGEIRVYYEAPDQAEA